jgi:hypothetical protein
MMRIDANSWYYSPDHGQLCQVIEAQTLWGETTCRVWLPGRDSVVRKIPENVLQEDPKLLVCTETLLPEWGKGEKDRYTRDHDDHDRLI